MQITWMGHSCFLLQSDAGTRLLTDPPDPETGYTIHPVTVDAVTSSHDHHDHAYFDLAPGAQRITGLGEYKVGPDMTVTGFPAFHDNAGGSIRGKNIMYRIDTDGLRLLHAGDLGDVPDEATVRAIGRVDVLFIPIGGVYTVGPEQALAISNLLKPRVVIPMHYKTAAVTIMLGELMPFLNASRNCAVHRMREPELTLTAETLGTDRIVVLQYDGEAQ